MAKDTTPEARLEKLLYDGVRRLGGIAEKMTPTRWGIPDRLVLLPGGRMYLVELKAVTGALRPAQSVWHRKAAKLGTNVVVLTGVAGVKRWLFRCAATLEADRTHRERTQK